MSKKNIKSNWGINLATCSEKDLRERIEEMRSEQVDENVIGQMIEEYEDIQEKKAEYKERAEDEKAEEEKAIKGNSKSRRRKFIKIPNGIYKARMLDIRDQDYETQNGKESYYLEMKIEVTDFVHGDKAEALARWFGEIGENRLLTQCSRAFGHKGSTFEHSVEDYEDDLRDTWFVEKSVNADGFEQWNIIPSLPDPDRDIDENPFIRNKKIYINI